MGRKTIIIKVLWAFNFLAVAGAFYLGYSLLNEGSDVKNLLKEAKKFRYERSTSTNMNADISALSSSNVVMSKTSHKIDDPKIDTSAGAAELMALFEVIGKYPSKSDPKRQACIIKLLFDPNSGNTVTTTKPPVREEIPPTSTIIPVFYKEEIKYMGVAIDKLRGWLLTKVEEDTVTFEKGRSIARVPIAKPISDSSVKRDEIPNLLPNVRSMLIRGGAGPVSLTGAVLRKEIYEIEKIKTEPSKYIALDGGVKFLAVPGTILPKMISPGDSLYELDGQKITITDMKSFESVVDSLIKDISSGSKKNLKFSIAKPNGIVKSYTIDIR